ALRRDRARPRDARAARPPRDPDVRAPGRQRRRRLREHAVVHRPAAPRAPRDDRDRVRPRPRPPKVPGAMGDPADVRRVSRLPRLRRHRRGRRMARRRRGRRPAERPALARGSRRDRGRASRRGRAAAVGDDPARGRPRHLARRPARRPRAPADRHAGARGARLLDERAPARAAREARRQAHDPLGPGRGRRDRLGHGHPHARGRPWRRAARPERHRARPAAALGAARRRPLRRQPPDGRVHPDRRVDERHGCRGHGRMTWQFTLTGLLIGSIVGLTGMGGGSLMTPILVIVFGFKPTYAVGTDIVHGAIFKTFGAIRHRRLGTVHARLTLWMFAGSGPLSLLGVWVATLIKHHYGASAQDIESYAVGAALVAGGIGFLAKSFIKRGVQASDAPFLLSRRDKVLAVIIGAVFGFVVGLTSVGSGTFFGLVMVLVYPLTMAKIVGTDIFHAAALLWVAGIGHMIGGNVDYHATAWLLTGSIPGVLISSRFTVRLPDVVL